VGFVLAAMVAQAGRTRSGRGAGMKGVNA